MWRRFAHVRMTATLPCCAVVVTNLSSFILSHARENHAFTVCFYEVTLVFLPFLKRKQETTGLFSNCNYHQQQLNL